MKYAKKTARALVPFIVILGVAAGVTGCVSPFYGTARIEKGFHMDAGLAATSYIAMGDPPSYCVGGRGDFEARYGLSEYFGFNGRLGLGYGAFIVSEPNQAVAFTGNAAIGMQAALPLKYVTPALRVEVTNYVRFPITPTLLLGIGRTKEILTLGARLYTDVLGLDVFLGIHPDSRWSIFGGANIARFADDSGVFPGYPLISLGVGYKLK